MLRAVAASSAQATHDVGQANSQAAMLALAVTAPAICVRTDFSPPHIFYLTANPASNLANWVDTGEFGAGGANPTAQVGPAPINGVAATYMRSDGAPAINLTAAYTWTGQHTFTGTILCNGGGVQTSWAAGGTVLQLGTLSAHAVNIATNNITRITVAANGDMQAAAGYTPANPRSIATKEYVDAAPANMAANYTWTGTHIWSGSNGEVMRIEPSAITFGRPSTNGPAIEWAGNNSPWEFQGVQGDPGATVVSTGNATTPGWGPIIAGGAYTPTITPGTNIASAAANGNFIYSRVGATVHIAGSIDVTANATGPAVVQLTTPVAVTFSDTHKLSGSGAATNGTVMSPAYVRANSGAQTAIIDWVAPNTQANTLRFTAIYTTA